MKSDSNTTLSHVYGLAGLVPGLIGLVYLFKNDATWAEYALFGSGWGVAAVYAFMLMRAFSVARRDGEQIGELRERVADLERDLDNRSATLDYVASLHMGKSATRRVAPAAKTAPPTPAASPSQGSAP